MESREPALRTVDVARRSGYSVQQIRDLERDGVLPPVTRTPSGYRVHTEAHVRSASAYRALAAGVGPVEAKRMMRAAHRGPAPELLELLDAAHARLHAERRELRAARAAVAEMAAEPIADPRPSDAMSVSELAGALGLRTSALRHWDAEGLLTPHRAAAGAARVYTPADVRDARVVHQLRLAGYGIGAIRDLLPLLRRDRRRPEITEMLAAREASVTARSRALLHAAAALIDVIRSRW